VAESVGQCEIAAELRNQAEAKQCAPGVASAVLAPRFAGKGFDFVFGKVNREALQQFGRWSGASDKWSGKIASQDLVLAYFQTEKSEIGLVILFERKAAAERKRDLGRLAVYRMKLSEVGVTASTRHHTGNLHLALGALNHGRESLIVVHMARQNEVGIAFGGLEAVKKYLVNSSAAGVLRVAGERRVVNRDDKGKIGIGGGQLPFEPVDLVLVDFAFGLPDVRKEADDSCQRGREGPKDVGKVHLCPGGRGLARAKGARSFCHEVLNPTVQRKFGWVNGTILRIVGLAVVVARDGDDEAGVILIGLVEVGSVLVDVAGKVDDVTQMIEKGRLLACGRALSILGHQTGHKVLLGPAKVTRVADSVKDHSSGGLDALDVGGGEQLGKIEAEGRGAVGRRKRLEGKVRGLEVCSLRGKAGGGDGWSVALAMESSGAEAERVQQAHGCPLENGVIETMSRISNITATVKSRNVNI